MLARGWSTFLASPVARLVLAPVLIFQGLRVRRVALQLPEPDGPREGRAGSGRQLSLLICGDSSAAGVGASTQDDALSGNLVSNLAKDHDVAWRLIAKTGARTGGTLAKLRALDPMNIEIAVVALGVNDVTRLMSRREWRKAIHDLTDCLITRHGARLVLWSGLPPVGEFPLLPQPLRGVLGALALAYDRDLARIATSRHGLRRIEIAAQGLSTGDMAQDGFHPGPPIYAEWARSLAEEIRAHR